MRFLPHAHRISLLSPAPVSHIFHSCRPSMPRKQKAALVPTPIKQNHEAMVVSYRPQTLHDTIHTVLPGEVLPAIPSYSEFIAVRLFVFQLTASRRGWHRISDILNFSTVISTNSLTKRLTNIGVTTSQQMIHFNSQPHEEADGNFRQKYIYLKLFFTLIAHINLVFYSNHYIVNFFLVKYTHFLVRMSWSISVSLPFAL